MLMYKEELRNIGNAFHDLRDRAGITQAEASKRSCGYSRTWCYHFERGKYDSQMSVFIRAFNILGFVLRPVPSSHESNITLYDNLAAKVASVVGRLPSDAAERVLRIAEMELAEYRKTKPIIPNPKDGFKKVRRGRKKKQVQGIVL